MQGEAALTIGLNNVFVGIWGVLQVANLGEAAVPALLYQNMIADALL